MSDAIDDVELDALEAEAGVTDDDAGDAPAETPVEVVADDTPGDAVETPAEDAPAAETAAEPAPATPTPEPTPFAVSVYGEPYAIPGVVLDGSTLKLADDKALPRLQQLLSAGRRWEIKGERAVQEIATLRAENARLQQERPEEVTKATVLMDEWSALMDRVQRDPNAAVEFVQQAAMQWPLMQAKMERAVIEQMRTAPHAPTHAEDPDVILEEARGTVAAWLEEAFEGQAWATGDVRREIAASLSSMNVLGRSITRADRDDPSAGIVRGQWVLQGPAVAREFERLSAPWKAAHARLEEQRKTVVTAASAAQTNTRVLQSAARPSGAPRPASPPAASPAPGQTPSRSMRDVARWALAQD